LFTRSFDVQAVTTLDLGYIVFGEDYKRGELLVNRAPEFLADAGEGAFDGAVGGGFFRGVLG
jgi:hypothetical protein